MRDRTKTGVSEPHLADRLFEIVFRSGSGAGVIVGSLFECPGCTGSSELISDGTASLDNPPELEMKILQLILSELTVMLVYVSW